MSDSYLNVEAAEWVSTCYIRRGGRGNEACGKTAELCIVGSEPEFGHCDALM